MALVLGCLFCAQLFSQENLKNQGGQGSQGNQAAKAVVAVMEPVAIEGSNPPVSAMDKVAIRSVISVRLSRDFSLLDRARIDVVIDEVADELKFQRNKGLGLLSSKDTMKGMTSLGADEDTMKGMRSLGADFICRLEMMREGDTFILNAVLVDVESSKIVANYSSGITDYSSMEIKKRAELAGATLALILTSEAANKAANKAADEAANEVANEDKFARSAIGPAPRPEKTPESKPESKPESRTK
jgi:hypothetical protein